MVPVVVADRCVAPDVVAGRVVLQSHLDRVLGRAVVRAAAEEPDHEMARLSIAGRIAREQPLRAGEIVGLEPELDRAVGRPRVAGGLADDDGVVDAIEDCSGVAVACDCARLAQLDTTEQLDVSGWRLGGSLHAVRRSP